MNEQNFMTLYGYKEALINASVWIAQVAYIQGSLPKNIPISFRWFTSYGLKIEIESTHLELMTKLQSAGVDVHTVLRAAGDSFSQRKRLEADLCRSIALMLRDGLPNIKELNAITVCSLPSCRNSIARKATICEAVKKNQWVCEECLNEIKKAEAGKRKQRLAPLPVLKSGLPYTLTTLSLWSRAERPCLKICKRFAVNAI